MLFQWKANGISCMLETEEDGAEEEIEREREREVLFNRSGV